MIRIAIVAILLQEPAESVAAEGLTTFSISFMLISMTLVTGLTIWAFSRILRTKRHFDPDGTGPARPPVAGEEDRD